VLVVCCVDDLCEELIARSEECYRVYASVCDLETRTVRRPGLELGCGAITKKCQTAVVG